MSRIVVTTLGRLGDLHPTIALALRQCSHDVVFVTHQVYRSKLTTCA
jgi:rhamnosyltransferase subunit B